MNTPSSVARSCMRTRSPSNAPPEYGEDGSTAMTATRCPRSRSAATLAAATTERSVARADPATPDVESQRHGDAEARHAHRGAHGDRAAVDVDLGRVEVQVGHRRQAHRREGFVELDQVDVVDADAFLG